MTTDNFDSFAKTCERFVDILRYDEYHLDVVGAILRLAELHKQENAAKDDERLTIVANYEKVSERATFFRGWKKANKGY